jgi:hypothetical protein
VSTCVALLFKRGVPSIYLGRVARSGSVGDMSQGLQLTAQDLERNDRLARRKAAGHVVDLKKVPGIEFIADQVRNKV